MFRLNYTTITGKNHNYDFIFNIVRIFKYDLIKVLIFICLFVFSLLYVQNEKEKYYTNNLKHPASTKLHD